MFVYHSSIEHIFFTFYRDFVCHCTYTDWFFNHDLSNYLSDFVFILKYFLYHFTLAGVWDEYIMDKSTTKVIDYNKNDEEVVPTLKPGNESYIFRSF